MAGGWSLRWTPSGSAYCLTYDEHTPTLIVQDGCRRVVFSILPKLMDEIAPGELAAAESLYAALGEFIAACHAWTDPTTPADTPDAPSGAATAGGAA